MPSTSLVIERVLTLLAEMPTRLAALTADLSPEALQMRPTPEEWSANEVLAHLRACADVWGNYIRTIIVEDRPQFRAVSPRTWIKQTDILTWHFGPRSVPLRRSVPSSWLSSLRCRLMLGNALREFRRWEGSSNRPCSPMQSGYLSMNGRTSSKSQASRARCTRERDLKMVHEPPHSMRGFMTSHIFHENAWPSSLSGQARPFL
jgi:hypothetical protein